MELKMNYNKEKQEERKKRLIEVKISDENCERISRLCGQHGLTIESLFENFIEDLVCGTYSNGSDECDLIERWFNRCWFGMFPEETLLKWVLDEDIDVKRFLELPDDIKNTYEELKCVEEHPEEYGEGEIECLKEDIEYWEQELNEYKTEYQKKRMDDNVNWEKEVEEVREWYEKNEDLLYSRKANEYDKMKAYIEQSAKEYFEHHKNSSDDWQEGEIRLFGIYPNGNLGIIYESNNGWQYNKKGEWLKKKGISNE